MPVSEQELDLTEDPNELHGELESAEIPSAAHADFTQHKDDPVEAENSAEDSTVPKEAPPPPATPCPRCPGKLINPDTLGWCPACGYSKAIEAEVAEKGAQAALKAAGKSATSATSDLLGTIKNMPLWPVVLLTGACGVGAGSYAVTQNLAAGSFERALFGTMQLGGSVLVFILAQIWTVMVVAGHDEKIGMKDCLLSVRLWVTAYRRLPKTQFPIWVASWAATSALCAALLVGGLSYWMPKGKTSDAKGKSAAKRPM